MMQDVDAFRPIDTGRERSRIEVGEARADANYEITTLDEGANVFVHQLAIVHADIVGERLVEHVLSANIVAKGRFDAVTNSVA
jgi:hypothetical protein